MACLSSQQVRVRKRIQVSVSTQDLHLAAHTASQLPTPTQAISFTRTIRVPTCKSLLLQEYKRGGKKIKNKKKVCSSAVNQ